MAGSPRQTDWQDLGMAWNAVIELVAATIVYGALGWFADAWLGTGHVLFILGLLGGNALGFYVLVKRAQAAERTRERDKADADAERAFS
ncbi:MAG TPA: AtpZ/AtpI family protein [Mycobacteriales bacterium]|nr:AtpZ/AtpI family protein [Mycobacteriales bacterium]